MKLRENLWQFLILGLAVSLALSIYADIDELVRAFGLFDWWLFPLVLGLTVGNQLLRFLKWEYLLREIDITLPLSTSVQKRSRNDTDAGETRRGLEIMAHQGLRRNLDQYDDAGHCHRTYN
ncbi:MAG: hypothetical protein ABEI52_04375 [Halobacteriaceae archaeon]